MANIAAWSVRAPLSRTAEVEIISYAHDDRNDNWRGHDDDGNVHKSVDNETRSIYQDPHTHIESYSKQIDYFLPSTIIK